MHARRREKGAHAIRSISYLLNRKACLFRSRERKVVTNVVYVARGSTLGAPLSQFDVCDIRVLPVLQATSYIGIVP